MIIYIMKIRTSAAYLILSFLYLLSFSYSANAHDIIFCGEQIPVDNNFVATRLMNVIRRQIPQVNLPQLRQRVLKNFPRVEYYLRQTGLPEDFKYLAIVESGFLNVSSSAGARGFWQLMPATARDMGLLVNDYADERDNIDKATLAACKVLADYYKFIQKRYKISSWILTSAAYNFGIGNLVKSIEKQGKDYFSMNLNPETAVYVYKIIAVKELFEYPELYMKNFGYNVFSNRLPALNPSLTDEAAASDTAEFRSMEVKVSEKPNDESNAVKPENAVTENNKYKIVTAKIQGKYKNFEDGRFISIELQDNLEIRGRFNRKGTILQGTGWAIDDKIFIDIGFNSHDVILYDSDANFDSKGYCLQGIKNSSLKNNHLILLKIKEYDDQE